MEIKQYPKIEIRTILEKGTAVQNEDFLIIQDNILGVFDGATSLNSQKFGQNRTGGTIASRTAGAVFKKNHFPLNQLACQANDAIMAQMISNGVDTSRKENLWCTSAAVVRLKEQSLEWIQSGDAVIILIYEDGSHRVLVDREDHDHETLTLWKELVRTHLPGAGKASPKESRQTDQQQVIDLMRGKLADQIRKVRSGMNITYGVLNGEKAAEAFLNQGEEPLDRVAHVLLFTDGLSIPQPEPEPHKNFTDLVRTYLNLGLEGLKQMIRSQEKKDPHCLICPRFKCHDDIAAIAVRF
ncbi:protein phosphatase 2C domain-containing protein [Desulfobacter curvatus]|uniref:protein phosphatase 2C domain-containing protein n=1 Tax=Desulfobacter curvatus TaxID=2290 RepID=UPI0003798B9F|nr:protein phosphatase 2C domain-containing protein [Desulfobacter curvatus]